MRNVYLYFEFIYFLVCVYIYNSDVIADIDVIIANGEYFVKIHFDLRLFRYAQANVYIALYKLINFVFFNVPRSSIKTDSSYYSPPSRQYGTIRHSLEFISCQIILFNAD